MNINICIENAIRHAPEQVSVVFENKQYTNKDIYDEINRLTNALLQMGCTKGTRIGYLAKNRPECIIIFYAAARIGAIFTPFDYTETTNNLLYMMHTIQPDVMFVDTDCLNLWNSLRRHVPHVHISISINRKYVNYFYYQDLITHASNIYYVENTKDTDPTAILFTSGTTTKRKAVAFSHINFIHHIFNTYASTYEIKDISSMLVIPVYHILGFQAFTTCFYYCRRLVMMKQFDPEKCLQLLSEEQVHRLIMSPASMAALLKSPEFDKTDLSSLHNLQYSGDNAGSALVNEAINRLPKHVELRNLYGLTETTFDIAALTKDDHDLNCAEDIRIQKIIRLGSIGRPLKEVKVIIADDDGNELSCGDVGEILIHSERNMIGYVSPETHEIVPYEKYWIYSGDIGYMDEDGYIFLLGQKIQTLPNQKGLRSPELSKNFIVYPYTHAGSDDTLDIYSSDLFRLKQIINQNTYIKFSLFLKNMHKQNNLTALNDYYLNHITEFIPSSAFGLHILPREITFAAPDYDAANSKWYMPYFDTIPLYAINSNIHSGTLTPMQILIHQCKSLQEYIQVIKPNYLICTPLFDASRRQIGILSFGRIGTNWPFSNYEQALMRIISGHMCIAITNALEHDTLVNQNIILENIIQVTGTPAIVTDANGTVIYENHFAKNLLERDFSTDGTSKLADSILKNIALIQNTNADNICRRVHTQFTDHSCVYNIQTSITDFMPPIYISIIAENSDSPNFSYLSNILSDREIEIMALISQGFNNSDISELLHISTNTVKYHLKNMFQKFDVSTRTELLTKAYSLKQEISYPMNFSKNIQRL